LILPEIPSFDRPEHKMQDVENDDVILIEVGFVGARRESEDELEVCELVELDDQCGLKGASC